MHIMQLFKCFNDELRLRILNLLKDGPLCVCHLVEIIGCEQVKMSKQLRYMKELGVVEGEREAQWIIYRLVDPDHPILKSTLENLQSCCSEEIPLQSDRAQRRKTIRRLRSETSGCSALLLSEQHEACC